MTATATRKPRITSDDRETLDRLTALIAKYLDAGAQLTYIHKHRSASNMSYRYELRLFYFDGSKVDNLYLNWWLATTLGETLHHETRDLKGNGIGTDRAFLAKLDVQHALKLNGYEREIKTIQAIY